MLGSGQTNRFDPMSIMKLLDLLEQYPTPRCLIGVCSKKLRHTKALH